MTYIDQIKRLSVKVNAGSGILVKPFAGNHLFVFTAYHVIKDLDDSEIVISLASDLTEVFSYTIQLSNLIILLILKKMLPS